MIRIDDPANLGPAVADLRTMLRMSRRELARAVAERTGRSEDSVNTQLWTWDKQHRVPDVRSLGPVLAELGYGLAIVPLIETAPQTAPESTLAAEHPSPGVLGCAGGPEGESGASEAVAPRRRLRECVERWPGAEIDGDYDPRCCRFPKSCSASVWSDAHVTDDDLEDA